VLIQAYKYRKGLEEDLANYEEKKKKLEQDD
jgi:hypothetical protein